LERLPRRVRLRATSFGGGRLHRLFRLRLVALLPESTEVDDVDEVDGNSVKIKKTKIITKLTCGMGVHCDKLTVHLYQIEGRDLDADY
jgi:hypothetical protein